MPGTLVRVKDQTGPVAIDGDAVRRPAGPWMPAVHALLDHRERAGFAGSPHAVSADGQDVVTCIPGESVHPHARNDEGVFKVGRLLRSLHEATASFVAPAGAVWHPGRLPVTRQMRSSATGTPGGGTSWPATACRSRSSTG